MIAADTYPDTNAVILPDKRITYGELMQHADTWEVPEEAPALKPASEFR